MLWIVPLNKYMGPTSRQQCPPHILYFLQTFYRVQVYYEPGMFLHRICIRIAYALTFIQWVEDVIIMPSLLYDFCFCVDLPRDWTLWHIWDGLWSEFKSFHILHQCESYVDTCFWMHVICFLKLSCPRRTVPIDKTLAKSNHSVCIASVLL